MYDYLQLASRNLKHRGVRSWLTLLGIFIGVAAVVSLISLGNGLKVAVNSQFGVSSTQVITVQAGGLNSFGPPGTGAGNPLKESDVEAIDRISGVGQAVGRNIETAQIEFNDRVIIGYATNIPMGQDGDFMYEINDLEIDKGRKISGGDSCKIVVGQSFYTDSLGLEKKVGVGNNILIQGEKFGVAGILEKKGSFIWDGVILMPEDDLNDLYGNGEEVDIIAVHVEDKEILDRVATEIEKLMRDRRDVDKGKEDFEVSTPEQTLETVNSILGGIQAFIVIIALISVVVGAIGIVNTMTTAVMERRKEIGVMKAIGATNYQVFIQFFIESSLLGLIGGIVGVIVGTLIGVLGTFGINNFIGAETPLNINFILIGFTLLGSFLIGGLAGISPAMKAAKQNPVEVLRG